MNFQRTIDPLLAAFEGALGISYRAGRLCGW